MRIIQFKRVFRHRILAAFSTGALAIMLSLGTAHAADLTVDQIVQMHQANLPASVIVSTIQSTGAKFNLSVSDVKRLKKEGVPQSVIDVMTQSGSSAAPAPEPAPAPAPEPAGQMDELEMLRQQEDAERGQIEEEARIREAARRAADKMRKRVAAEERKRVAQALQDARDALEDNRYSIAAVKFDRFIQSADPSKASTWEAKLGLADALYGMKLYGNAAERYHDALSAGSDDPVFVPAFEGLRRCAKKIAYNPVTLEALTNNFVGNKKTAFQNSYNYFLGKFFFDYTRFLDARKYLSEVTQEGADYADAQYLLGLIQVAEAGENQNDPQWPGRIIGASQFFQRAVTAANSEEDSRVAHLAYLALARISYSVGLYDVAIFYYRKIPYDSTSYVNALHESGWSYFLKGDVRRGLGIFHTLEGPDWDNVFLPDMHLLEATVYMNTCHFKTARLALKRIDTRFLSLKAPLETFITAHATPDALYQAFVLKQGKPGVVLPRLLRTAVITNSEFYDLYTTVTQYRREIVAINRKAATFGDDLTARLLSTVDTKKKENAIALGIKINRILQQVGDELEDLEIQRTEVKIEINTTQAQELRKKIEESYQGKSEVQAAKSAQATASIFVGDLYVTWPFEGEFWADEVNSYRSDIKEVCKR